MSVHIDCFSALDDLPAKQHGDSAAVEAILRRVGRFSTFEVTPKLGRTIDSLRAAKRIRTCPLEYPWVKVEVIGDLQC